MFHQIASILTPLARGFYPLMIIAGLIPFAGMVSVLLLVRNTEATGGGLVRKI